PEDARATRILVLALLDRDPLPPERLAEARAIAAAAPSDMPKDARELIEGRLLLAEGRSADAVAHLAMAVRGRPLDPFAALFHGEALFRTGERALSLAEFRRAAAAPEAPTSMRAIAATRMLAVSRETKDTTVAENLAREASRLTPTSADPLERLVEILQARGDAFEAAQTAQQALALPNLPPAQAV